MSEPPRRPRRPRNHERRKGTTTIQDLEECYTQYAPRKHLSKRHTSPQPPRRQRNIFIYNNLSSSQASGGPIIPNPFHAFPLRFHQNGTYVVGFGREAAGLVGATSRSGNSLVGSLLWLSGFLEVEGSSREKNCLEAFWVGLEV